MMHTPEHTHSSCFFSWVLFIPSKQEASNEVIEHIHARLEKRYTVYSKEADIPKSFIYEGKIGQGYSNGFDFVIILKIVDKDTIEVTYQDFEDPMAAGYQTIRYQWTGKAWNQIDKSNMVVS